MPIVNDYEVMLRHQFAQERGEQKWRRNDQFVVEIEQSSATPSKPRRFSLRLPYWPQWHGFRHWFVVRPRPEAQIGKTSTCSQEGV